MLKLLTIADEQSGHVGRGVDLKQSRIHSAVFTDNSTPHKTLSRRQSIVWLKVCLFPLNTELNCELCVNWTVSSASSVIHLFLQLTRTFRDEKMQSLLSGFFFLFLRESL